jgi:hypothetical protein
MKQPLNEQFTRMQKLAGIIPNTIKENMDNWGNETDDYGRNERDYKPKPSLADFDYNKEEYKKYMEEHFPEEPLNENQINENLNFDYQDKETGPIIVMDGNTMDAILDNPELQDYINPKSFTRNNKGEIVLGVDNMDYEQFDKLAKFLGIKY